MEEDKNNYSEYSIKPTDIKIIDPCMGSGHILTYIFDVLMEIYLSEGFTKKDAAQLILTNNLFGLDIDNRAYQLAYFALMMKARKHDRKLFKKNISLNIYPAIRDLCLHSDIHTVLPSGSVNRRSDVVELDIFFSHLFLIKNHQTILLWTYLKIL